ncbi:hypothetical protein CEUSTIGMA_g4027.t1 [Chlamydomonas eustigma]|uniref:Katanin p60 ATPase-containing subunit A-like 2 n=1 Tax=Chlamydomonas eustigma TaxID=1157962 RepID=A0A250X0I1_9CHLO|nr:hypothetical protein CEUSTIGMA_g4027.t1 [Chlamydomonas eustigma]|eukprot:GAX76581.1 hypothetical protein CEUSTIGMA_g4027.t1 [Chlamydomonas eustigma]
MSDLQALKYVARAREAEEKRLSERRRHVLVLILRHLVDFGYIESYEKLSSESNLSLQKADAADNMDLLRIVQEFEDGYELKYNRRPKLVKRLVDEVVSGGGGVRQVPAAGNGANGKPVGVRMPSPGDRAPQPPGGVLSGMEGPPVSGAVAAKQRRERGALSAEEQKKAEQLERRQVILNQYKAPPEVGVQRVGGVNVDGRGPPSPEGLAGMQVKGVVYSRNPPASSKGAEGDDETDSDEDFQERFERRVLKPLPASLQGEMRELGAAITRDIFTENPNVRWEDISGLEQAKRLLKEAVVQPIKYPELFTGLLAPWKGLLLYGPPGTGKTMLAKAVATECKTTFFNIHASTIISKWRGDSEKLVRVLFELARHHAPSTIFLDEVDALMGARGGEGEHEASRRMKTELLVQMDGLARSNALVFVLSATNLPWELDMAMLRRLEKRIYVSLPDTGARLRILETLLGGRCSPEVPLSRVAELTEGYSGSDVFLVAKEAAMRPLRRLMTKLEAASCSSSSSKQEEVGVHSYGSRTAAAPGPHAGHKASVPHPELGPIEEADVQAALTVSKASAKQYEQKYKLFHEEYGQVGS